jgi:hypothetical protein
MKGQAMDQQTIIAPTPKIDLVDGIMRWEAGEMPPIEELDFFKHLVATGLVFQLQGMYGRRAHTLGLI